MYNVEIFTKMPGCLIVPVQETTSAEIVVEGLLLYFVHFSRTVFGQLSFVAWFICNLSTDELSLTVCTDKRRVSFSYKAGQEQNGIRLYNPNISILTSLP